MPSWRFEMGNCIFGMDLVNLVGRAWNFSVPMAGEPGELQFQQLKFPPQTRRPSAKDLLDIGMFEYLCRTSLARSRL